MTAPTAKRQILSLAKPPAPSHGPALWLVKKAIRLYRGRGVPKETYRRHALEWLKARERMGDQHILNKAFTPTWGQPGDGKGVAQIHAPRRLAGS